MCGQVCEMVKAYNKSRNKKEKALIRCYRNEMDPARQEGIELFGDEFAGLD